MRLERAGKSLWVLAVRSPSRNASSARCAQRSALPRPPPLRLIGLSGSRGAPARAKGSHHAPSIVVPTLLAPKGVGSAFVSLSLIGTHQRDCETEARPNSSVPNPDLHLQGSP